uniref:Uncharacterized protein n=1 Tax=Anguilla anguilla TaxID=7936 RepID=A0A0E9QSF9_ANGAN
MRSRGHRRMGGGRGGTGCV